MSLSNMAISLDPYSSGSRMMQYMDTMQKEMEYRFRELERNQRYMNHQPMYVSAQAMDGTQYTMSQVAPIPETAEQKTTKERAKKLRNLIAYYYSR